VSLDKSIEKRLERYVMDELSDSDRALLEEYLTGTTDEAAQARAELRFEKALIDSLDVEPFTNDLASNVLDRLFKRTTQIGRRNYCDGAAAKIVREGLEGGRIASHRFRRSGRGVSPALAVVAMIFVAVSVVLWKGVTLDRPSNPNNPGSGRDGASDLAKVDSPRPADAAPLAIQRTTTPLARVAYTASVDNESMAPMEAMARSGGGSAIFAGN